MYAVRAHVYIYASICVCVCMLACVRVFVVRVCVYLPVYAYACAHIISNIKPPLMFLPRYRQEHQRTICLDATAGHSHKGRRPPHPQWAAAGKIQHVTPPTATSSSPQTNSI